MQYSAVQRWHDVVCSTECIVLQSLWARFPVGEGHSTGEETFQVVVGGFGQMIADQNFHVVFHCDSDTLKDGLVRDLNPGPLAP